MEIIRSTKLKAKPCGALKFGSVFTDHMLLMDYSGGAWKDMRIVPYANFSLDPAAAVFHYGQAVFEGLKAYRNKQGEVRLFRYKDNLMRINESCERLCIPKIDVDAVAEGLRQLIKIDKDWIPSDEGTSLYIRPFIFASEVSLSVHASHSYIFCIILSPVGAYYANGLSPVSLYVESEYVRAAKGGTGHRKFAGNYAASLLAGEKAEKAGYDQVMWLDAKEQKYVEEVGSMNIFFVLDGSVITPALNGSILPGITRRSVIEYLGAKGVKVEERRIEIEEIIEGAKSGRLSECFGSGTAAVVSPVGRISFCGKDYAVGGGKMGAVTTEVYDSLTGIQTGRQADAFGWTEIIK